MSELCFLGTGGWIATRERDNTSLLVDHDNQLFLVDCPGSVIQKLKKLKFEPERITSILVTHVHPDHIYGLPSLVHSMMFEELSICLYGTEETVDFCQKLLDLFQLRDKRFKCRVNFVSLSSGQRFRLSPSLSCFCLSVPHHPSSLAFVMESESLNKRLLYSGDTPLHPPVFEEAEDIDYLVHECSAPESYFKRYPILYDIHTNAYELGRLSQESRVKCLIPCHIFGDLDFSESDIEKEIRENYRGRLVIPQDLMRIEL
ncbi:MAG: MBL fold metallo-hydrolase [Candidatus Aminicenantes bacterium]